MPENRTLETFSNSPLLLVLRTVFPLFSKISEKGAASLALKLFLTPPKHKIPNAEIPCLKSAMIERVQISGKEIVVYTWGSGSRKILLCHSWGGRATQFSAFIQNLIDANFQVVGFDAPAHGLSPGKRTDMIEYSNVLGELINVKGPFHGILGHSFGAGNALFARVRYQFEVKKIALVGCFAHGISIAEKFGHVLNIPSKVITKMRDVLEAKHYPVLKWDALDMGSMASKVFPEQLLFIHDRNDREIPFANAEDIMKKCSGNARLLITEGLGHRRILRDLSVVQAVQYFFESEAR